MPEKTHRRGDACRVPATSSIAIDGPRQCQSGQLSALTLGAKGGQQGETQGDEAGAGARAGAEAGAGAGAEAEAGAGAGAGIGIGIGIVAGIAAGVGAKAGAASALQARGRGWHEGGLPLGRLLARAPGRAGGLWIARRWPPRYPLPHLPDSGALSSLIVSESSKDNAERGQRCFLPQRALIPRQQQLWYRLTRGWGSESR